MLAPLLVALIAAADPLPLSLTVGKTIALCTTATIQCPAANPICDDTSIVTAADSPQGLVFKGVKKGATLCSAASANGLGPRQVYRVVVKE